MQHHTGLVAAASDVQAKGTVTNQAQVCIANYIRRWRCKRCQEQLNTVMPSSNDCTTCILKVGCGVQPGKKVSFDTRKLLCGCIILG